MALIKARTKAIGGAGSEHLRRKEGGWLGREGRGREGKGREGKGREGKGREGKGREGKGREGGTGARRRRKGSGGRDRGVGKACTY
ncbi:MAG: hypothetical protein LBQ12_01670, partial [Deltaproteobacteria bacterium]|nr:hypothetical protein [Deltaproteobacteria bacterium]